MDNNYVVIMAGGTGTRFWPYSRIQKPKQFLDILGVGKTLLQLTFERFASLIPEENIYVVTSADYGALIKEQLPQINNDQLLLEPSRKNTAPCIAYACSKISAKNSEACIIISPSDHAIIHENHFYSTIKKAISTADDNKLITIGISPTRPDTGYGYIQFADSDQPLKRVKTFTEKPNRELAEKFIESGDYVWNAGIFIWKAKAILHAFEEYLPEIHEAFSDIQEHYYQSDEQQFVNRVYMQFRGISVDYGIMEKSSHVHVLLGKFSWMDLGYWDAMHDSLKKDDSNNLVQANSLLYNTSNSIIKCDNNNKLVVVEGLEDYIVADCDNVLLICKKNNEAKMREFVNDVKTKKGDEYL